MPRNELHELHLPITDEIGKRAGSKPRVRPADCAPFAVADQTPKLVFSPRTLTEASKIVKTVAGERTTIIVRGGGTKQWRPPHPREIDVVLDASRCSGVIEYTAADLTVTVAGGTRFADLQDALRARGQFFPNDPPFGSQTTVGGMLSANSSGALRQRFGPLRDNVLGMRVCLGDGAIAFTGAKVVKSVAGYDIAKLFVGGFGTLGFIGEVTLKVAPLPQDQRGVVAAFSSAAKAGEAAERLAASALFPLATTLHDRKTARRIRALAGDPDSPWTLVVRCGGGRLETARQTDEVRKLCIAAGAANTELLDFDQLAFAWTDISEAAAGVTYSGRDFVCCAIVSLPTQVPAVLTALTRLDPNLECTAHPDAGVCYGHLPAPPLPETGATMDALVALCETEGWSLSFLGAPPHDSGVQLHQPVPPQAPVALMRRIKAAFDPAGTFDPGRFLGGI